MEAPARNVFRRFKKSAILRHPDIFIFFFYDIVMHDNSQRINSAPQLISGLGTPAAPTGHSILNDLEASRGGAKPHPNARRRLHWLTALALSASAGASVVLYLQGGTAAPGGENIGAATDRAAITHVTPTTQAPVAPLPPAATDSSADVPSAQPVSAGAAIIQQTPQTSAIAVRDTTTSHPVIETITTAAIAAPPPRKTAVTKPAAKKPRPKVAIKRTSGAVPRTQTAATQPGTRHTGTAATERDVDIITAIVKDSR